MAVAHHLNISKQFMVGNGILALAATLVVVTFIYISLCLQQEDRVERHYIGTCTINPVKGFAEGSISLFVNNSLIANQVMQEGASMAEVDRLAEQSVLMTVDNKVGIASIFDLSEKGRTYQSEKETDGIGQLVKQESA